MVPKRQAILSAEGWPWLIGAVVAIGVLHRFAGPLWALLPTVAAVLLYLLFRDPQREVTALPTAVLAPVDGRITEVARSDNELFEGAWWRITMTADPLGAYTVRAPIEGHIHGLGQITANAEVPGGMLLRTEEDDDVVLMFPSGFRLFRPKSFCAYGERVGHGQRFAYLRLAPRAQLYVPATAEVRVTPGDRLLAGVGIVAELRPQD